MYMALLVMLGAAAVLVTFFLLLRPWLRRFTASGWRARLMAGLTANRPERLVVAGLVFGALPWLWETLAITVFAHLAGISLTPPQAFTILTAFNVVTVLPLPGNFGLHEAASSFALVSFGVSTERAMAFAILYHLSQLLPGALCGAIVLVQGRSPKPTASISQTTTKACSWIATD